MDPPAYTSPHRRSTGPPVSASTPSETYFDTNYVGITIDDYPSRQHQHRSSQSYQPQLSVYSTQRHSVSQSPAARHEADTQSSGDSVSSSTSAASVSDRRTSQYTYPVNSPLLPQHRPSNAQPHTSNSSTTYRSTQHHQHHLHQQQPSLLSTSLTLQPSTSTPYKRSPKQPQQPQQPLVQFPPRRERAENAGSGSGSGGGGGGHQGGYWNQPPVVPVPTPPAQPFQPAFRKIKNPKIDLRPVVNVQPVYRRARPEGGFISVSWFLDLQM